MINMSQKTTESLMHRSNKGMAFLIPQGIGGRTDTSSSLAYTPACKKDFSNLKASPPGLLQLRPKASSLGIVSPQNSNDLQDLAFDSSS